VTDSRRSGPQNRVVSLDEPSTNRIDNVRVGRARNGGRRLAGKSWNERSRIMDVVHRDCVGQPQYPPQWPRLICRPRTRELRDPRWARRDRRREGQGRSLRAQRPAAALEKRSLIVRPTLSDAVRVKAGRSWRADVSLIGSGVRAAPWLAGDLAGHGPSSKRKAPRARPERAGGDPRKVVGIFRLATVS